MDNQPEKIDDGQLLYYALTALTHAAEVDGLCDQFDFDALSPDVAKAMENLAESIACVMMVGFGAYPKETTPMAVVSHLQAAFILGRRAGTITLRVAEDETEQSDE